MTTARPAPDGTPPPASGPPLPISLGRNPRLSRWLTFSAAGRVTLMPGKVELGQGILTALRQIAAEELDVAPARVDLRPAATPDSPDEGITSGSLSVQESGMALRHACAEARAIHLSVAAQRSGVPLDALRVEDGAFVGPAGPVGSYWAQAGDRLLEVDASPGHRSKPAAARRLAGTDAPRLDLPDKVFGAARFLHDLRLPGMLHARVVRPSAPSARLAALREGPLPGDARTVRDGDFLAVVAGTEADADAAAARLAARATWNVRATLPDNADLPAWLTSAARETEDAPANRPAPPEPAARTVRRRFLRPFLAHASIGTSCAVARWDGDAVEVWTHSQGVFNLRADLATALRLPLDAVLVRHAEGAGCYGHNGADDVALDAALAARAHPGRPVRMLWDRAQELGCSPHSPAMLVEVEAGTDAEGNLLSWRHEIWSNGHSSRPARGAVPNLLAARQLAEPFPVNPSADPPLPYGGAHRNAVPIYRVPGLEVRRHRLLDMPVRASALRGLGALANVWAIEAVMDELAELAGADPLDYRLRHLDDARAAAVLREAAVMAGWPGAARAEGEGFGLGVARYKNAGAWCAVVARVEAAEVVRVRQLWIAADVGEVVNPDGAANQLEGGAIQATSIALREAVPFDRERVTIDGWEEYPILRFSEVPRAEVRLLAHPDAPPLGAGEASMGPTIAAIANAVRDALGVRPRAMPFTPDNIAAALDEA